MDRTFTALIPALALLATSIPAGALLLSAPVDQASAVAVLFPPWSDGRSRLEQVAAAGAMPVRVGAVPFLWVVRSDEPGLPGRLRRAGLLILLDPEAAWGCAPTGTAIDELRETS